MQEERVMLCVLALTQSKTIFWKICAFFDQKNQTGPISLIILWFLRKPFHSVTILVWKEVSIAPIGNTSYKTMIKVVKDQTLRLSNIWRLAPSGVDRQNNKKSYQIQ